MSKRWGPAYRIVPLKYVTPCWIWLGGKRADGYGMIWMNGKNVYVHRYFYEKHKGLIPEGLEIDHLCRNRDCVNPEHMEAVSHGENLKRSFRKNQNCVAK